MNTSRGKSVSYQKQRFVHQSAHHSPPLAARPSLSVTPDCRRGSFTLIEILVVITIIGILAGMVFKMMGYAGRQSQKAQTIQILEKVAHALEEYKAEYGQYPPADGMTYKYENNSSNYQPPWLSQNYFSKPHAWQSGNMPDFYKYGLVSYLAPRARDMMHNLTHASISSNMMSFHGNTAKYSNLFASVGVGTKFIDDEDRDKSAKARWAHFLEGIISKSDTNIIPYMAMGTPYSNSMETIKDAWSSEINYECKPPYLTCKLWSSGLDGKSGTADDIHKDGWDD